MRNHTEAAQMGEVLSHLCRLDAQNRPICAASAEASAAPPRVTVVVFRVHRAERADQLAEGLARLLADPLPDPFARELVIVPAKGVERWLSQRLSHRLGPTPGSDDGVCAAVDFGSPAALVAELLGTAEHDPWAPDVLVWPLLRAVDEAAGEPWAQVLGRHLGDGVEDPREAALRRGRRFAVARRLAGLFASYAAQRPRLLEDWTRGRDTDGDGGTLPADLRWQAELWRRVAGLVDAPPPGVRHRRVVSALSAGELEPDLPPRLSLFGHTTMRGTEVELLAALGAHHDVHLWLPHPSPALWEHREPTHPLLVTLGRDVRELQAMLDAAGALDVGAAPAGPSADAPTTLLGRVQADLAADRLPRPAPVAPGDASVQVHACHGAARQVEVLREVLLGLLADDPTLEPRDIVVMCPDVEAYAPLVSAAFGLGEAVAGAHPGHQLRVMLADRSPTQTNPLLGVLAKVLELADGRVEASRVLDLLATDPVRRRFALSEADLETVTGWVSRAGIRWAYDAGHRVGYDLGDFPQNTWRFGLDRILAGVALSDDSGLWLGPTLPLDDVASTSIALAGRLAEALDRLQALTDALRERHPVERWLELLREGVERLADVPRGEEWQLAQLHRELARIGTAASAAGEVELGLADVRSVLHRQLAGRPTRASFRTGTLTVCALTPMRSVPHRVVCLLGLDDEVFPRRRSVDGDDVLARGRRPGERNVRSQDRQLFLDAVLAAQEHLVITYTGFHEATGHPRPPSVPVQELLDVLEASAPCAEDDHGRCHVVRHRSQSFHRDYLRPGGLIERGGPSRSTFSFDPDAAGAARAAAADRRPLPPLAELDLGPAPYGDVDIADLIDTVANPVRAFLRRRLGVDLPWEQEPVSDQMPVGLSGLEEWQVGDRMLAALMAGRLPEDVLQAEWRRGTLPPGRYGWRIARRLCAAAGPLADTAEACRQGIAASAHDLDVDLGGGRRLVGTVAGVHGDRLVRVGFSRLRARQRLEAWIALVALGAAGRRGAIAGTIGRAEQGDAPLRGTYTLPADPAAVLGDLVAFHDAALGAVQPFAAETARAYVRLTDSRMPAWKARKEIEKCWRRDARATEVRLAWGTTPPWEEIESDPRLDRWARAVWAPALAAEVE